MYEGMFPTGLCGWAASYLSMPTPVTYEFEAHSHAKYISAIQLENTLPMKWVPSNLKVPPDSPENLSNC
jgi:hypothetical protein